MRTKPIFNILILTLSALTLFACGGGPGGPGGPGGSSHDDGGGLKQASQAEVKRALNGVDNPADKESSVLGKKIAGTKGDIAYGLPEDHPPGSAMEVIAVTPYQRGFKVFFHSLLDNDPKFVCDTGFVVQKGNILSMARIADNQNDYSNDNSSDYFYKGYIESGVTNSCGDYDKDTVWVVVADTINGFDPLQPYTLIFTGLTGSTYDDLSKVEISINDKTDKTIVNKNYLGKKIGNSVTKIDYARHYPEKEFGFNATITPYEKGFKVIATSSDEQMCFSVNSHVYQDGARYEIEPISNSWYGYFANESGSSDGYIESGFFDSCEDLPVDTTYVIKASKVGFNPKRPYTVKLGSVNLDPDTGERQAFEIKPNK